MSLRANHHVVGIDLGGTWLRAVALDANGRPTRRGRRRAPTLAQFPSALNHLFRQWDCRPVILSVASRGVWTASERRRMAKQLSSLADHVIVISDVEAAWLSAFDGAGEGGILVIAGTGSIAYGRDADGCAHRAGGLGPLLGDEGSAFWIGREWLRKSAERQSDPRTVLARLSRTDSPVRHIAALAATVQQHAKSGDPSAKRILAEAQNHLAALVHRLAKSLHWHDHPVPVSTAGSVLGEEKFQQGFRRALQAHGTKTMRFHHVTPQRDAATAAALYGLHRQRRNSLQKTAGVRR